MPQSRWDRIKDLFSEAVGVAPASRSQWIDHMCGDDAAMRQEIETLVRAHDGAGDFLAVPALSTPDAANAMVEATTLAAAARPTPDRCGAYRILREFARGGMGVVYLGARADDLFEKLVAVKLVSHHLVHPAVIRRFEDERRILALLDHPHIARLLDAGTTEAGVPYVVMEWVEGEPIDVYCSTHRLSVRDRLVLIGQVCAAVQYSHQHLVVHRDIKARNVLVTPDGVPKLLDFGIAKLLEPGGIDGQATRTAFRALTPESASPEQVRGEPVTVLTDVYSLGVLLYRLLTDRSPYRGDMRTESGISRVICDEEPLRPSDAVASPGPAAMPPVASHVRQRSRELRGDLDLITLKALRKDPARRYASVEQLSQDIRRHLDRLPILAAPDAWTYRGRKFLARHWMGVAAVAAVIVALAAGGATTWWQARRAERRFNDVRSLAHMVMFDFHDAIAMLPGSTPARRLLVTNVLQYLDRLTRDAGGDAGLQRELATAYEKMADVLGWPNTPNLGDVHGALATYQKAQAVRGRLLLSEHGDVNILRALSTTSQKMSRAWFSVGDPQAGAEEARKASRLEETLAASDHTPDQAFRRARSDANYGYMLFVADRTADSLVELRRAAAEMERLNASGWRHESVQARLAATYTSLALVLRRGKPVAGTVPNLEAALEMQQKAVALDAPFATAAASDTGLLRQAMIDLMNLGEILQELGDRQAAGDTFRQGLAKAEQLARADAANLQAQSDYAWTSTLVGVLLAEDGQADEALVALSRAETLLKPVAAADAANVLTRARVAGYSEGFGNAHAALASRSTLARDARTSHWREARARFMSAYVFWQEMRDKGILAGADAARPQALALEIAKCDVALGHPASVDQAKR